MPLTGKKSLIWVAIAALALAVVGYILWQSLAPQGYGSAIASGNGRLEATEIDIATKQAGRIEEILVEEGEFVEAGQLVARMNTNTLQAELRQVEAELQRSQNALQTARANVAQSESYLAAAEATVHQRQAEQNAARQRYERSNSLLQRNVISHQQVDDDRAAMLSAQAAVSASQAQVAAAQAQVAASRSQVIESESAIAAAQANVERVQSEIDDSLLHADRLARVQYRIAEPGEVLGAGGKVINLVDLTDVYMTFFLPTAEAGQVSLGDDVHLILDALPNYVIPARVSFVSSVAQFTPRTVETSSEREKLMFRIRARIDPELLREHIQAVKTGVPGTAYVKLDATVEWPDALQVNVAP
ncbi:HlyD family secretion protein [Vreelandella olivaria]|uniref:HlyD family secretion protein n=1 Tax=Vreelandella olivaria TaxID=390919 RepID=UPI00201F4795|nr:HlyD family efflux transporter periplasmic adaptor subunit [Halomonas olivaria]